MRTLGKANGTGSFGRCNFNLVSSILKKRMDFFIATELTTAIESHLATGGVGFVVGNEGGGEIDGMFLLAMNGNFDTATLAICNDKIASLSKKTKYCGC